MSGSFTIHVLAQLDLMTYWKEATACKADAVSEIDIFVSSTGHFFIFASDQKLKNNSIVGNTGHFNNEIDWAGSEALDGTSVDVIFVFPFGTRGVSTDMLWTSRVDFLVAFLLVFTVLRTAVNSDFVYCSMACSAIGLAGRVLGRRAWMAPGDSHGARRLWDRHLRFLNALVLKPRLNPAVYCGADFSRR